MADSYEDLCFLCPFWDIDEFVRWFTICENHRFEKYSENIKKLFDSEDEKWGEENDESSGMQKSYLCDEYVYVSDESDRSSVQRKIFGLCFDRKLGLDVLKSHCKIESLEDRKAIIAQLEKVFKVCN